MNFFPGIFQIRSVTTFIFVLVFSAISAQTIPPDRTVDWSVAGFPGEIPAPATILNVMDYGATADGVTNDRQAILDAIAALNGNQGVVFFPPGVYLSLSNIPLPDSVVLRGGGSDSTFLNFDMGGAPQNGLDITSKPNDSTLTRIIDGFLKDSDQITVLNSTGFSVGDYAEIRQDNGAWDVSPATWATRSVGQIVMITGISGNILSLENPLRIDFDTTLNLDIRRIEPRHYVGIECLSLERLDDATVDAGYNIHFSYAAECWVKGVEGHRSVGSHLIVSGSSKISIQGCYFHDAFTFDGAATRGYGVTLIKHSGEVLVEDNIFKNLRHAMMVKQGANGNVFGYNYAIEPHREEAPNNYSGDISLHGHYAFANLFEGNVVENLIIDHYWGPSGPGNVIYRNRADLYGIIMSNFGSSPEVSDRQVFIGNEVTNTSILMGNFITLGVDHFSHGNNVKGTIMPGGTNDLPDESYYLSEKPGFWFVTDGFPSVGIPNQLSSGMIPAQKRYLETNHRAICEPLAPDTLIGIENGQFNTLSATVMPNPFSDRITVQFEAMRSTQAAVSLFDLAGRQVYFEQPRIVSGENRITVSSPGLAQGIYVLKLKVGDRVFYSKVVRQ